MCSSSQRATRCAQTDNKRAQVDDERSRKISLAAASLAAAR